MRVRAGSWSADMGPELEAMVRRVGDGALASLLDTLQEYGDERIATAQRQWPVFSGASKAGLRAIVAVSSTEAVLTIRNDATKAMQTAYLKGQSAPPANRSRSHFASWAQAKRSGNTSATEYGYVVREAGSKLTAWKRLVLDPEKERRRKLVGDIAERLKRLAEGVDG